MDSYRQQAELFRAIAHPARLRILDVLFRGEACVCHLTAVLGQRQPYVSQQLALLRAAGLVTDRRERNIVYYRLVDQRVAKLLALGRQILQGDTLYEGAGFLPVPEGPWPNCPCPRCREPAEQEPVAAGLQP